VSQIPPAEVKRVLVIRIGRLGDTVLATPVIEALRSRYGSDISIDFVTSPGAPAFILSIDERINRIFPVKRRRLPWRLEPGKRRLQKHAGLRPYDLVINLECGSECDDFQGFVRCGSFLGRPGFEPRHQTDRHCVDTEKTVYAGLLGEEATAAIETSLKVPGREVSLPVAVDEDYVVLNPGFSALRDPGYRSHRGWPVAHWKALVDLIRKHSDQAVLLNGTQDEAAYFKDLLEIEGVHPMFGCDLETLVHMLRHASCLVSVDTGTLHLAAALKTPVVGLYGPGNPALTGPYPGNAWQRALSVGLDCQPCVNTPLQKGCKFNRCMAELTPQAVFDSLKPDQAHHF
jgi:ADP-heptose:LPS heptosyltransferase